MFLLDRIEEEDKEYYDRIFNEYKTAYLKMHNNCRVPSDEELKEYLETSLESAYDFKADFVYELNDDDLILDNLYEFTEFCSKNIERLL